MSKTDFPDPPAAIGMAPTSNAEYLGPVIPTGLQLLRKPFAPNQISKLPKPTKAQTDAVKADFKVGIRCGICGAWHHPKVVHLDYVGHAALTDRLLDADPAWNWEPVAVNDDGTPKLDASGGMWIKLTVCGVTRLGYGHADGKLGGDAIKETIGDCLRNAAMRFGAALDLWHKGDLHIQEDEPAPKPTEADFVNALASATAETIHTIGTTIAKSGLPEDARKRLRAVFTGRQTQLGASK